MSNLDDICRRSNELYENSVHFHIPKSIYYMSVSEMDEVREDLNRYSAQFGEPVVLVHWGHRVSGTSSVSYCKKSSVEGLFDLCSKYDVNHSATRIGLVVDSKKLEGIREKKVEQG